MSDKKTRLAGQSEEEQPLEQGGVLPESDNASPSPFGKEELPSPTELLNDLLAGLESDMQDSASAEHEPASVASEQSVDQPVNGVEDASDGPVEEPEQGPVESTDAANHASEPIAEEMDVEATDEAEANDAEENDAEDEIEIPPVMEKALTVPPNGAHGTEGMTLIERAQYHAKMRRREQTRLRRENAKRGASGAEIPYQAMTPTDMRFTLIRLAIAAIFLIFGVFLRQTGAGFVFYLIAYLIRYFRLPEKWHIISPTENILMNTC